MTHGIPAWALLALSLSGTLHACRRAPHREHLDRVGQLLRNTDSLSAVVRAMDTTAFVHMAALFSSDRNSIEACFLDTLPPHDAEVLGNYHRVMDHVLPATLRDRERLLLLMDSTRQRLGHLEHDLEHAALSTEEEAQGLAVEQAKVDELGHNIALLAQRFGSVQRDHDRYRSAADSILRHKQEHP
jgi:hypothetical protein